MKRSRPEKGDNDRKKAGTRSDRPSKPFKSSTKGSSEKRSFGRSAEGSGRSERPYRSKESGSDKPPFPKKSFNREGSDETRRPFNKDGGDRKPFRRDESSDRPSRGRSEGRTSERSGFREKSDQPGERRAYKGEERSPRKSFDKPERPSRSSGDPDRKPFRRSADESSDRPRQSRSAGRPGGEGRADRPARVPRSFGSDRGKDGDSDKPYRSERSSGGSRPERSERTERESRSERSPRAERTDRPSSRSGERGAGRGHEEGGKSSTRSFSKPSGARRTGDDKPRRPRSEKSPSTTSKPKQVGDDLIRLNKFISNSGICSRREADMLIQTGVISVNGQTITELGYKISPTDIIKYNGETIKREQHVYLLLNKPKDYITTLDDPEGRKTVFELIRNACNERIYPVGRLDRATTGVLLFTNDGDLTRRLTHPKFGIKKLYHVQLDHALSHEDLHKIREGVELEDGVITVDEISFLEDGSDKRHVGVEIHSGKNRVIRRLFEALNYDVVRLDRVSFAGLTKKDLPRGRWRFLSEKEVGFLKMVSA